MSTFTLQRPWPMAKSPAPDSRDDTLRGRALQRLAGLPGWDAAHCNLFIDQGTAVLQGLLGQPRHRRALHAALLAVPGVHAVQDARVPRRDWQSFGG